MALYNHSKNPQILFFVVVLSSNITMILPHTILHSFSFLSIFHYYSSLIFPSCINADSYYTSVGNSYFLVTILSTIQYVNTTTCNIKYVISLSAQLILGSHLIIVKYFLLAGLSSQISVLSCRVCWYSLRTYRQDRIVQDGRIASIKDPNSLYVYGLKLLLRTYRQFDSDIQDPRKSVPPGILVSVVCQVKNYTEREYNGRFQTIIQVICRILIPNN